MKHFTITKYPVIIIANRRSGSTALASSIAQENKLQYYDEPMMVPWDKPNSKRIQRWHEYYKSLNNQFVLKIIADVLTLDSSFLEIFNNENTFKIKLNRRNKIEQLASYYVSSITNVWHHVLTKDAENVKSKYIGDINDYKIPYNVAAMKMCAKQLFYVDGLLEKLSNSLFNIVCDYEELEFNDNSSYVKILPPSNIQSIKELARITIKNLGMQQ